MPAPRAVSIAAFLVSAACVACMACSTPRLTQELGGTQESSEMERPGEVKETAKTYAKEAKGSQETLGVEPTVADTLVSPPAHGADSTEGEREARQAARVDPGILMYRELPAGTEMPTYRPPEDVDPGMTLPGDSSLHRADTLRQAEPLKPKETVDP